MRILHIHTSIDTGGIETFITSLSQAQSKQGCRVSVCSIFAPKDNWICWHRLDPMIRRMHLGKTHEGVSIWALLKIAILIGRGGYDVVHIHGNMCYYLVAIALWRRRCKFVYTVHNDAVYENNRWDQLILPLKRWLFAHGWVHPVTISPESQRSFSELYHCPSTLIVNGVCLPGPVEGQHRRYQLLHAGRICAAKNQEVLCQAVTDVRKDYPQLSLDMAGEVQDTALMSRLSSYLDEHIRYTGCRDDIVELMQQADALCLPSLYEGLPIVVLEAMAVGCVPLCAPVGGIVNIVHDGENGLLSRDSSLTAYTNCLRRYLKMSEEEVSAMRERAMQDAQQYNINKTAAQYVQLYVAGR